MIKKLRNSLFVFKTYIYQSLFDIPFYESLHIKTLMFSFRYLFCLIFLLICIYTIITFTPLVIEITTFFNKSQINYELVKDLFPDGLALTIKDGILRTNVDEPYYVDIPKTISYSIDSKHLLVFDTKNTYSSLIDYQSSIVITKNNIYIMNNLKDAKNDFQTFSLKEITGYYVINKTVYLRFIESFKAYLPHISIFLYIIFGFFLIFFPILTTLVYLVALIIYLLFFSILIYYLFMFLHIYKFSVKRIFQISLHAITVSIIFQLVQSLLHISVPYTFTVPFFILMTYILNSLLKNDYSNNQTIRSS